MKSAKSAFLRPQMYESDIGDNVQRMEDVMAKKHPSSPIPPPYKLGGPPNPSPRPTRVVLYPNEIGPLYD